MLYLSKNQTDITITADEILQIANMSEEEVRVELALPLYQRGKLSMGQAARLAGMNRIRFQFLLGSREIPVNYNEKAFQEDLDTIHRLTKRQDGRRE